MYLVTRSALFLCLLAASATMIESSDSRGISYCNHDPAIPYVCQACIKDLNKESMNCTCSYGILKNESNSQCPYHYEKYLNWLEEEIPDEYYKLQYPEERQQQPRYQAPAPTSTASTLSTSTTSTSYQPVRRQQLSASTPAKKSSSSKVSAKELKSRTKKSRNIKRTKSEKKSATKKKSTSPSASSSLSSSAEKQVHFDIVPEEIGDRPRVMRRSPIPPAQQKNTSSSEEEKEYEKRHYSDDE